jgi:FkbM family methyltransferase
MLNRCRAAIRYFGKHGIAASLKRALKELGPEVIDRHHVDEVGVVIKVLKIKLGKGVMVDVGAHHGGTAYPFASAGWLVYAFEPDVQNREHLVNKVGRFKNVTIDDRALSSQPKKSVTFYRSTQSTGISGLSAFHESHAAAYEVEVTTLQHVVAEHHIAAIDFLKIDTEGFDKFVLEGLPWDTHSPRVIVAEFEDLKTKPLGYDFHDFARYLLGKGYQLLVSEWSPIVAYGGQHTWAAFKTYPCELGSAGAWGNFIACKERDTFRMVLAECERITRKIEAVPRAG